MLLRVVEVLELLFVDVLLEVESSCLLPLLELERIFGIFAIFGISCNFVPNFLDFFWNFFFWNFLKNSKKVKFFFLKKFQKVQKNSKKFQTKSKKKIKKIPKKFKTNSKKNSKKISRQAQGFSIGRNCASAWANLALRSFERLGQKALPCILLTFIDDGTCIHHRAHTPQITAMLSSWYPPHLPFEVLALGVSADIIFLDLHVLDLHEPRYCTNLKPTNSAT